MAFSNTKSSQAVLAVRATRLVAFKRHGLTHLLSPWERFEGLVVCANFGGMQITRPSVTVPIFWQRFEVSEVSASPVFPACRDIEREHDYFSSSV